MLDTVQRLARRLVELAAVDPVVEGLNQDDLAALIGASREAVAKALQALRAGGLVRTGRRSIEVLDLEACAVEPSCSRRRSAASSRVVRELRRRTGQSNR